MYHCVVSTAHPSGILYVAHLLTSHPRTKYTAPNPEFPIFMTVALLVRYYKAQVKNALSVSERVYPTPSRSMTLPFANHGVRFTRHSSLLALITC